jgi:hypothetical protein
LLLCLIGDALDAFDLSDYVLALDVGDATLR